MIMYLGHTRYICRALNIVTYVKLELNLFYNFDYTAIQHEYGFTRANTPTRLKVPPVPIVAFRYFTDQGTSQCSFYAVPWVVARL